MSQTSTTLELTANKQNNTENDSLFRTNLPQDTGSQGALSKRGVKGLLFTPRLWFYHNGIDRSCYGRKIIGFTPENFSSLMLAPQFTSRLTPSNKNYNKDFDYTDHVNAWSYANFVVYETQQQRQSLCNGRRIWEYERTMHVAKRIITAYGASTTIKKAKSLCDFAIYVNNIETPRVQMDNDNSKESVQGLVEQESDKQYNTIITRDEGQTSSYAIGEVKAIEYVSTEPTCKMNDIVGRWMPLPGFTIGTQHKQGDILNTYKLPGDLYSTISKSANLLPFTTFVYGKYEFEFKFVVNGNKFQCGKVIAAAVNDSWQATDINATYQAALCRPHVILDIPSNTEGNLHVPFKYHRSLVRNIKNGRSVGVRTALCSMVRLYVLSQLRTGTDGATEAYITPFVRIVNAEFAGMSHTVSVQMDSLAPILKEALPSQEVKTVLASAERLLKTIGETKNRDKPAIIGAQAFIPKPRLNFGTGKGLIDAQPLRMNPYAMTSFATTKPFEDEPKTTLEIAQIWGLRSISTWKTTTKPGDLLVNMCIDPTVRKYGEGYDGVPTPLEYIASMYNFWAGTIEMRIDFVSNAFHSGAVMISAEFGREISDSADSALDSASTYTKTYHLGEQKSVTMVIPYIYDTVWRRSNNMIYQPLINKPKVTEAHKKQNLSIRADSKTFVKVRVVNELRTVQAAPAEIDMLIYWRATPNFMFHGLKQSSMYLKKEQDDWSATMDNFPADDYAPATPTVQMDKGDKEDEDETETFNYGQFNLGLQTTDSQLSIKDILRRPVLLMYRQTVTALTSTNAAKTQAFFIPLMPPSRNMMHHGTKNNSIWSEMIGQTPQACIMNMFRFWRGTMRYTIVMHSGDIVYTTHVPHSGTRLLGNRQIMGETGYSTRPIHGCGLSTDIIVRSVNPTSVVEVPYDTENDWTLTFEEDTARNYTWRDKGDYNSGHLALSADTANSVVSVWWSAGDDFEVGNFYGVPKCKNDDNQYMYNDTHARVQMDFRSSDGSYLGKAISIAKQAAIPTALASLPIIGNTAAVAYGVVKADRVMDNVNSTLTKFSTLTTNLDQASSDVLAKTDMVVSNVNGLVLQYSDALNQLQSRIDDIITSVLSGFKTATTVRTIIENAIFDIIASWLSQSWEVVGIAIVRIIYQVVGQFEGLYEYGKRIGESIKSMFGQVPQVQVDMDKTFLGLLCALVGSILRVSIDADSFTSWHKELIKVFTTTSGISYMNQVIRFVQVTFDCIKEIILEALGLVDPQTKAIKSLCTNNMIIADFVTNAQMCLNEANTNLLLTPNFRLKFWHTTIRAYQIQKAIVLANNNIATSQLARLTADVIKVATEKFVDLSCSPVRYEPFIMCFTGPPGIGKSHLTERLVARLMKKIGFNRSSAGLTYTRSVGSKYWNSYRDQPVIIYDDAFNLNDSTSLVQQLSELFQLKTTTKFIPEMADLAQKNINANPLMVVMVCNDAFPNIISQVAFHKEAVFRRREIILEARLNPEFVKTKPVGSLRDCLTPEQSENLEHMQFTVYGNVQDPKSRSDKWIDYETLMTWLEAKYLYYHRQEQRNVQARMRALESALNLQEGEMLGDPFELFYSAQNIVNETVPNTGFTPSEQLEAAVAELSNLVTQVHQHVPIVLPEKPIPFDEVRPQIDFGDIVSLCLSTSLAAPDLALRATKWTVETFTSWLPSTDPYIIFPRGECCVCKLEKVLVKRCANETETTHHSICQDCIEGSQAAGRAIVECPMCRSRDFHLITSEHTAWYIKFAIWVKTVGAEQVLPVLNTFLAYFNQRYFKLVSVFISLANILKSVCYPHLIDVETVRDITIPIAQYYFDQGESFYDTVETVEADNIHAQADVELDVFGFPAQVYVEAEEVEPVYTPENEFSAVVFEERFIEEYKCEFPREMCMHHLVLEQYLTTRIGTDPTTGGQVWTVIYVNGNNGTLYVPDGWCCDTCPFKNAALMKDFYNKWTLLHKNNLVRDAITVYNAIGGQSAMAKARIPRIIRPTWMRDQVRVELSQNWWEYLSEKYQTYKTFIDVCLALSGTAAAILLASKAWNSWTRSPIAQGDLNYGASETRNLRRIVNPRRITPIRVQTEDLTDAVRQYIARNYVILKLWDAEGKMKQQMTLTGICGNIAILPKHYVKVLLNTTHQMTIEPAIYTNGEKNHLRVQYVFDQSDFQECLDVDLAVFKTPKSFPAFKDIRKFFQNEQDLQGYYPNDAEIVLAPTRKRTTLCVRSIDLSNIVNRIRFDDVDGSSFWVNNVLEYNHSEDGACGSMVLVLDHQRPIRAMHVAGANSGVGYGTLITKELLDEIVTDRIVLQYEQPEMDSIADRTDALVFSDEVVVDYIGALPKEMVPHTPAKSKIRPSRVAPFLDPAETQPAILSASDPRYTHEKTPLYYGAAKHGKTTIDFTTTELERAREAVWDTIIGPMRPAILKPKRLSYEEAITGIAGIEFYDPMRLDTSSGFPWQKKKSDTTKRAWCNYERDENQKFCNITIEPELLRELERKEELRKQGIVPCTIFVDTLKDERKKLSKLMKAGGTRVFCASPIDHTIATRQNYLHFCAAMMKTRLNANHAVGINAKGPEWTELFRKLTAISPKNIVMMDYSNFGPGFNATVAGMAADLMVRWTMQNVEGVDEQELYSVLMECINSVHSVGATVYRQFAGSPSGAAITTIINTLVNLLYLHLAWDKLASTEAMKIHPDIYRVFRKYTALFAYGDDFIMSVSDKFKHVFNTNTIRDYFATKRIAATSADKELVNIPDFVTIREATFLKRGFRQHDTRPHMILAPLEELSIDEIPKWVWSCADYKAATLVNVESALMEAHGHGIEYFEKMKTRLNEALKKARIETTALSWHVLDDKWFHGDLSTSEYLL